MEMTSQADEPRDRIMEFFHGRKILITGSTGFLGKVLLEKILRCLTGVSHIYLLVRSKKGKDEKQRIEELFNSAIFEKVKAERGLKALQEIITVVKGDVLLPKLGLSPEDRKILCENVDIVYHAAATVRFDEMLKKAVLLNTRGTKLMIELAKEMTNLTVFVYVSTAYCHLDEKVLAEKTYPPPANPHDVIKTVEWMDNEVVEAMTSKILGSYPNTYAFTKALAEGLVEESFPHIPSMILRPSIIIPVWKEPLPGWTDNLNGPTGLLIGAGKGVIRTMYCDQNVYADYLPVDIAVNGMLVSTWSFTYMKEPQNRVFHLTSSSEFQVSWAEIIERGRRITERVPLNGVVWYPGGSMKKSRLMHNICVLLFHIIPAYIIDALIFLAGHKPVMCRVQRRIMKGFEVFEYYANHQWDFENTHVIKIRNILNSLELKKYQLDGNDLDIDVYFESCIRAARIHVLNEPPETLPAARRHMRIMYWVDVITKTLFFLFLFYILVNCSDFTRTVATDSMTYVVKALK